MSHMFSLQFFYECIVNNFMGPFDTLNVCFDYEENNKGLSDDKLNLALRIMAKD